MLQICYIGFGKTKQKHFLPQGQELMVDGEMLLIFKRVDIAERKLRSSDHSHIYPHSTDDI